MSPAGRKGNRIMKKFIVDDAFLNRFPDAAIGELAALLQKYPGAEITAKAIAGRACREIVIQE